MANVTDQTLIKQITYQTLENGDADATGTTLLTSMFSIDQIVAAMNQRQWKFLKDTGCVMTRESIAVTAGSPQYTLSNSYIDTRRLAFKSNASGSKYSSLLRSDAYEMDMGQTTWQTDSATPFLWQQMTLPTRGIEIAPLPSTGGTLSHLYVALSATLTGLGVELTVPDAFSWVILYGVLADLLGSDGEGLDVARASYCEQRYSQGVELCRLMIHGLSGGA